MKAKPSPAKKPAAKSVELEVVPSFKKEIGACVKTLHKLKFAVEKKSRDLLYDIAAAGLYFLKLQDLHRSDHLTQFKALGDGGDTVTPPHNIVKQGDDFAIAEGFHAAIEREFCRDDIEDEGERKKHVQNQIRTAQRWMNLARNAGLTPEDDLKSVARLKKQHALDDKNATELYRLKDKEETGETPTPPAANLNADALADLANACDAIRGLREDFSPEEFDAAVETLRTTYEELTGAPMMHVEHAQVIAPEKPAAKKAAKRGGRK